MNLTAKDVALLAGGLVISILLLRGKVGAIASGVATGVVDAATGTVAGTAMGVGDAIGLPRTDQTKGQQDIARGDWWAASVDLPAGQFLSAVGGAISDWWSGAGTNAGTPPQ